MVHAEMACLEMVRSKLVRLEILLFETMAIRSRRCSKTSLPGNGPVENGPFGNGLFEFPFGIGVCRFKASAAGRGGDV